MTVEPTCILQTQIFMAALNSLDLLFWDGTKIKNSFREFSSLLPKDPQENRNRQFGKLNVCVSRVLFFVTLLKQTG